MAWNLVSAAPASFQTGNFIRTPLMLIIVLILILERKKKNCTSALIRVKSVMSGLG